MSKKAQENSSINMQNNSSESGKTVNANINQIFRIRQSNDGVRAPTDKVNTFNPFHNDQNKYHHIPSSTPLLAIDWTLLEDLGLPSLVENFLEAKDDLNYSSRHPP